LLGLFFRIEHGPEMRSARVGNSGGRRFLRGAAIVPPEENILLPAVLA
jgi:hypothetical protein